MGISALVGLAVGSQIQSARQAQKAAKAQRRAGQVERRAAEIQNTTARRRAIREAIIMQATYTAQAGAIGALGGTPVRQQLSSLQTQLGSNVSLQSTLESANNQRLRQLDKATVYTQQAQNWGALSSLATTGLSLYSPSIPESPGAQPPLHIPRGRR
jgi:hypothetical protein